MTAAWPAPVMARSPGAAPVGLQPAEQDDPQSRVTLSFAGPPLGAPVPHAPSSSRPGQPAWAGPAPARGPSAGGAAGAARSGAGHPGRAHPGPEAAQPSPGQPGPGHLGQAGSPQPRAPAPSSQRVGRGVHPGRPGAAPAHPALVVRSPTPVLPVPAASVPISPRRRRTATEPAQADVDARMRRPEVYDVAAEMPAEGPIPRTPRPLRITLGILFLVLSAWLGLLFLPGHKPLSAAEEAELAQRAGQGEVLRQREARLDEGIHLGGNVGAAALALAGIGFALSGALYRAGAQVRCRRCQRTVVAWKGAFGLSCPLGEHYARVQWVMVGLTALFWIGVLVVASFIGLWIL